MRDLDLKRRLELAGLEVTEIDGWQTRGSTTFDPGGSVHHHTAGPRKGVQPSLGICINGRSDLPGPLCNVHGPREESQRVNLVAAGRANHAGKGGWRGLAGNSSVYGLEEEHCGYVDEPVSGLRIDRMARVHAAFAFERFEAEMVCQHREWAPRRKPDFVAGLLDSDAFRSRVADILRDMRNPEPEGFLMALTDAEQQKLYDEVMGTSMRVAKLEKIVDDTGGASKGTILGRLRDSSARIEAKLRG